LVASGDVDDLAGRLVDALGGGEVVDALVSRGRARAAHFSWERCADGLVGLYRDAVASQDAAAGVGRGNSR
jgi:glycosyltransferase involved in cell wall biosynthesis